MGREDRGRSVIGVLLKTRHGCLTTLLVALLLFNAAAGCFEAAVVAWGTGRSKSVNAVFVGICVVNITCIIALFRWKKWGFWGLCATSAIVFTAFAAAGVVFDALLVVSGLVPLYYALNLGAQNKAWPQLE